MSRRSVPPPSDQSGMLYGLDEIAAYIRRGRVTAWKYIKYEGLPAAKTPQGIWFTHKALIMKWIMAGYEQQMEAQGMLEPGWIKVVEEGLKTVWERHEETTKHQRAAKIAAGEGPENDAT